MQNLAVNRTWLTEGVILASMSGYAYLLAFLYEFGYCYYFEIPPNFIVPSISTILIAIVALAAALLPALQYLAFTVPLFKASSDHDNYSYRYVYQFLGVFSIIGILIAAIYGFRFKIALLYVAIVLLFFAFLFLPAILKNRNLPLKKRLEINAEIQDNDPFVMTNLFDFWLTRNQMIAFYFGMVVLGLALLVGNSEAKRRVNYLTLKNEIDVVILRNYGDLLVTSKFNAKTKETTGEIRLIWMTEKKDISFVLAPVGPLKPKKLFIKAI